MNFRELKRGMPPGARPRRAAATWEISVHRHQPLQLFVPVLDGDETPRTDLLPIFPAAEVSKHAEVDVTICHKFAEAERRILSSIWDPSILPAGYWGLGASVVHRQQVTYRKNGG